MCNSCSKKEGWAKFRRCENQDKNFKKIFLDNGFVPLEEVTHSRKKILCEDKNGYRGYISKENIEKGKHFSIFSVEFNKENLMHNLENYTVLNHIKTKVQCYELNGVTYGTKLFCVCECGNEFEALLANFVCQSQWRCPLCSKSESTLEYKVETEIKKYCSKYEKQKRFDNCRNTKTNAMLSFDFYIPELNTCIEVDGEQHFKKTFVGFSKNTRKQDTLEDRQKRDKIKNIFCMENNIKLLRIPYTEFSDNNYINIIKKLFN